MKNRFIWTSLRKRMDNLKPKDRRKNMQSIRSKGTSIELLMQTALRKRGHRFKKNYKKLIGKPDIVFLDTRVAVFLDSCFWHSCPYHATQPKSNRAYWRPKLKRNKERDRIITKALRKSGWKVLRIWEHRIKNNPDDCLKLIQACVYSRTNLAHPH
jgi:DNA mismatch endonuclease, patch repair protein